MLKKLKCLVFTPLILCMYQNNAFSVTYKLNPGQSIVLSNSLNRTVSASCLISAVSNVVNTVSLTILRGSGSFNGTTATQGQTLYQNISNTQYIPLVANSIASARISNLGSYAFQAECTLN